MKYLTSTVPHWPISRISKVLFLCGIVIICSSDVVEGGVRWNW